MTIPDLRKLTLATVFSAIAMMHGLAGNAQSTPSDTFVMTISLANTKIHIGEVPVMTLVIRNPTDHRVVAGAGRRGGAIVELISDKGIDIGLHVMGNGTKQPDSDFIGGPTSQTIAPGARTRDVWPLHPEPGYLTYGVYKLRVHRLDVKSGTQVYSNTVTLTVVP
jgi:hypothetical protein